MVAKTILPHKPVLEPSATTILVTGATGFLASHIIYEALLLGYDVRGTARTAEKAKSTEQLFQNNPLYSAVVVSDFATATSEIEVAMKGVNSVVHVASNTSQSPIAAEVITPVVESTLNILRAAKKEPSVKRVTLTSSSAAVINQQFGGTPETIITSDSWNEESLEIAKMEPGKDGYPPEQGLHVYCASKVEGERAFWKFMEEEQPEFVANTVLPNLIIGRLIPGGNADGSWAVLPSVYYNQSYPPYPSMHFTNATDCARVHLAAAVLDDSLSNQRIFAFADQFNWNDVADAIELVRPDLKMDVKRDLTLGRDWTRTPREQASKLLTKWFEQDGFKNLHVTVKENLEGVN